MPVPNAHYNVDLKYLHTNVQTLEDDTQCQLQLACANSQRSHIANIKQSLYSMSDGRSIICNP